MTRALPSYEEQTSLLDRVLPRVGGAVRGWRSWLWLVFWLASLGSMARWLVGYGSVTARQLGEAEPS